MAEDREPSRPRPADDLLEREEAEAAAREARQIGGPVPDPELDPAERPLIEGGEGVSEGFELAEADLVEHATHGDQQSAHAVLHHQGSPEEPGEVETGDPDHERSSEREDG